MAVVLITGCSSGFGLAGALAFARAGDKVYATVRNEHKTQALQEAATAEQLDIRIKQLDVTQAGDFAGLVDSVVSESGRIDVLVNNAGVLHPGACEDLSEDQLREIMEVNFFAPMLLSRSVLPVMRAQRSGKIIMISSLSGVAGLAGDVFYSASKFALEGATEALRHEVDRWGIHVALIEAAQYVTNIFKAGEEATRVLPQDYPQDSAYRALIETKLQEISDGLADARDPSIVGELMFKVARSDGSQLRWQADDLATMVVEKMHGQSDAERDAFLRGASGIEWWSSGKANPEE